jgi:hypothetical protein
VTGVAPSTAMKPLEPRQARPPGTLRSPELARTGQGAQRTRWWGFGCENATRASEWRRRCSGQVGATPVSNLGHGEGESGALRTVLAPVRGEEHPGPKHGHGAWLNQPDVVRARRTSAVELRRVQIHYRGKVIRGRNSARMVRYLGTVLGETWRGVWSFGWPA